MLTQTVSLQPGKKLYFASDFHLGVPTPEASLAREKHIVAWLDSIRSDAQGVYLLGDIFDFWFEYSHAIPRGFIRLQGKLAELRDSGIAVEFFTGNHDMWMFDYFPRELGIVIHREPIELLVGNQRLIIGHGDGLGSGERGYKILKAFFNSAVCQWLFARLHPNLGMRIAHSWSRTSRINSVQQEQFKGDEKEHLLIWCREQEKIQHHDFYIFGHRHLVLDLPVGERSRYLNLGEWVHHKTYAAYDGQRAELKTFAP